jgi:hypothetical protein
MQRLLVFAFFYFLICPSLKSQAIYTGGGIGQIFKHRAGLPFEVPPLSYHFDLTYIPHINPKSEWYQYWHEPEFSIGSGFVHFGNKEVFGNAFSLIPGILFPISRNKKLQPGFYIGSGIAMVSRQYNYENNNTNIAISTRWNNCTRFGLKLDWKLSVDFLFRTGIQITHFSNGRSSSPNSGINLITADMGVVKSWGIEKGIPNDLPGGNTGIRNFEKLSGDISFFRGFTSSGVPEGASYHVNGMNLTVGYHTGDFFRLLLGFEKDYNEQMYHASINNFSSREEANSIASRKSVFLGSELFLGNFSIRNQVVAYVSPSRQFQDFPVHLQLMIQYYPLGNENILNPHFGAVLKTHLGVAEYVGIRAGVLYRHPKKKDKLSENKSG